MIYITGDTHGDMSRIVRFCERMETSKEDTGHIRLVKEKEKNVVIQIGAWSTF